MLLTRFKRSFGAFLVALFIGSFGGLLFLILVATGRLRVHGYWKLMRQVARGNTIIAANHPTLLETVIIPMMFWPWGMFWPKRFFPWSVPDGALFPRWLNWLYDVAHCVKVDREKKGGNHEANRLMRRILETNGTITVHPEAGRTGSDFRGSKRPSKRFGKYRHRRLRRIVSGATLIARDTNATIVPIWIDVPFWKESNGFWGPLKIWITRLECISIIVGEPYQVGHRKLIGKLGRQAEMHANNKELGSRILSAGLE